MDKKHFGAVHALILVLEYMGVQFVCGTAVEFGFRTWIDTTVSVPHMAEAFHALAPLMVAYGVIVGMPLAILVVVLQTRYWARSLLRDGTPTGIAWTPPVGTYWWGAALIVGIVWAGIVFTVVTQFQPPDISQTGPLVLLAHGPLLAKIVLLLLAIVIAPVIEEFLFRGAMFAAITRSWGTSSAVVLTSLAFVAVHLPDKLHYWPGLVAVGVLALFNCALRLRYRSIFPSIVAHFCYNTTLVILGAWLV